MAENHRLGKTLWSIAVHGRIASCLGSLDTLIIEQAKKLATLKTHKQGLMQGLFPKSAG